MNFCVMRYDLQYKTHTQKALALATMASKKKTTTTTAFLRVCSEIHYCSFITIFPIRSFMLRYCCCRCCCCRSYCWFICLFVCFFTFQFVSFRGVFYFTKLFYLYFEWEFFFLFFFRFGVRRA